MRELSIQNVLRFSLPFGASGSGASQRLDWFPPRPRPRPRAPLPERFQRREFGICWLRKDLEEEALEEALAEDCLEVWDCLVVLEFLEPPLEECGDALGVFG